MMNLLINEWMKAWYGRKVWIFMSVMGVAVTFTFFVALLMNMNFDLMITTEDFITVGSAMSFFVILYSFVLITGAISGEFASGTIKQLLIRPVSRHRILLSKWVASLLLSIGLYALMMLVIFLFGLFFPHQQSLVDTLIDAGLFVLYATPTFVFYVSFATLVAVITRNTAVTVVITILPYFFADIFLMIANQYEWTQWVVFRHIDVFTNYHPASFFEPPFESMWASIGFLGLHIAVFLAVSHIVFKKRDVI
ncbi:ABC transporter permease subunit [Geomicrobium sp. JCM 19039]|uniref:ABC transporter permease subunit n=1 Tax=Geomicrobium sp. JCM 19039 TaxID=1460636 RepID=UPI00045F2FAB|nr:ABC transporter permease subunit [Geomicrobium sp. JCM 19039]GAK14739.1 ABC transporter, permease protein [Geomicrobium sp. JCM 19039]